MLPAKTLVTLQDLPSTLDGLLPRHGYAVAPVLALALDVARHGSDAQMRQLMALGPLIQRLWQAAEAERQCVHRDAELLRWLPHEAPWQQAERLLTDLLVRVGKAPLLGPGADAGSAGSSPLLRNQWLMDSATLWDERQGTPDPNQGPPGTQAQARMSVLLFDPKTGLGQVAQLTMSRVHCPAAGLAVAAAPPSAFTPCTASFHGALQAAVACWRHHTDPGSAVHDTALAWDISVPGGSLWCLDGPSAGAALALCGLWLLRDVMKLGPLRDALRRVDYRALAQVHLTAELCADDAFGPVGHVPAKAQALARHASRLQADVLVYTAPAAARQLKIAAATGLRDSAGSVTVVGMPSLLALAQAVAQRSTPLTPAQDRLLQWLVAGNAEDNDDAPGAGPDEATLATVADDNRDTNPVHTLVQYALKRWAWWALALRGQVHQRFVPLRIVPDPTQLPPGMQPSETPSQGLAALLADCSALPLQAFMLRGSPGAGKSTLLQQNEQVLCQQALRRWAREGAWLELPLYLPLSALGAEEDPVAWLQAAVRADHPDCQPLHDLLHPSRRRPEDPPLRLMFDGLNELKHTAAESRNERAVTVLNDLRKALQPRLALLLSARTHHLFDLRDVGYVAPVDVQPWGDDEVRAYIGRRFRDATTADKHWQSLRGQPHVLDFCRNPFNLAGQCDLWADGGQRLATHRADLYRRLLWQQLLRQLKAERGQADSPLRNDKRLLTAADRQLLQEADGPQLDEPPPWPRQGALLTSLFRQGREQWLLAEDTHPGVPAQARGEVEVPWNDAAQPGRSVVHWLGHEPGLRDAWRQAVSELGLLDDFQARPQQGQPQAARRRQRFKWRHQSWGEYLASVDLLTPTPEEMPEDQRADLLRRLQAGRSFERSATDELEHQKLELRQRWALSELPGFWDKLLEGGVELPRGELQQFLRAKWGWSDHDLTTVPGRPWPQMGRWQQFEAVGAIVDLPEQDRCRANLRRWGEAMRVGSAIGTADAQWHQHPEGWARLVFDLLWPPFEDKIWAQLGDRLTRQLKEQPGRLSPPGVGDLDEVLGLALLGLPDPRPWLRWLLQQGLWCALGPCLQDLARRLEPQGAWPTGPGHAPDAVLQALRRVLLLCNLDAGAGVLPRVQASGMLAALDADAAQRGTDAALQAWWLHQRGAAFCTPQGRDLRVRLQAGAWLGQLGDNLRYERAKVGGQWHPGLRLKRTLWAGIGPPGQVQDFALGSGGHDHDAQDNETPATLRPYAYFEMARLAVTVGEWQRFIDAGGYNPGAPWWQASVLGSHANAWICDQGAERRPRGWGTSWHSNPLQPVVGITLYEALAYAVWAGPLYARPEDPLQLAVPSEALWEAGMRGPWAGGRFDPARQPVWSYPAPETGPGALDFNHANTRWGQPSPVGSFSTSYTAQGVADAHGNALEWSCSKVEGSGYDDAGLQAAEERWDANDKASNRALRGGSYDDAAGDCRVAYRYQQRPGDGNSSIGLRLVRCVLPHSEP